MLLTVYGCGGYNGLNSDPKRYIACSNNNKDKRSLSVKGEEIADLINRDLGTVRNQIQALRAIGIQFKR